MDETGIIEQISHIRKLSYALIEEELSAKGFDGVLPSHGNILGFLYKKMEPVPINTIVEYVGKAKSTVTSNLQTLEKNGYIRKSRNENDSRSTLISLSEKGIRLMPVFFGISHKLLSKLYGNIEIEDKRLLVDLLGRVENNLED